MTGAKPISIAQRAKDETRRTSCILWARSQIGNFEFGGMLSVIVSPFRRVVGDQGVHTRHVGRGQAHQGVDGGRLGGPNDRRVHSIQDGASSYGGAPNPGRDGASQIGGTMVVQ